MSKVLRESAMLAECKNNYLASCLPSLVELMQEFEKQAPCDYKLLFEQCRYAKRGDLLFIKDERKDEFYFLESGVARSYFLDEGEEKTRNFFLSHQFIDTYATMGNASTAQFNIHLLKDAKLRVINRALLRQLSVKYPLLKDMQLLIVTAQSTWQSGMSILLSETDATLRYLKLINLYPHYLQQLPLMHIASYLGLRGQSLSRIRKELVSK